MSINVNKNLRNIPKSPVISLLFISMQLFIFIQLLSFVTAQNIITENSNHILNNITILIDPAALNLTQDSKYIYTENDIFYNITDIVYNSAEYNCTLSGLLNENESTLSGFLEEEPVYHVINSDILDGIYSLMLYCKYNITTNHTIINISTNISNNETFLNNTFLNNYSYTYNYMYELNVNKELIVDTMVPMIEHSLLGNILSVNIQDMTDTQCIFIDNNYVYIFNITLTYIFNQSSN